MSDSLPNDPSKSDLSPEIADAVGAAKAEIAALLEEVKSKKAVFDTAAESAATVISGEAEKAKATNAAFALTAQASAESIASEIEKAKATNSAIDNLKKEIAAGKGAIDTERNEFVAKAKASQSEIEAIKTSVATSKGSIEATQKTASVDLGIVTQSKADVETLKSTAQSLSGTLSKDHEAIASRIAALQEKETSLQRVIEELSETKMAAEGDAKSVHDYLNEVDGVKGRFETLNSDTETQFNALSKRQVDLQAKIVEIEDANLKIVGLRQSLLETSDEETSVHDEIKGLQEKIDSVLKEVSENRDAAAVALKLLTDNAEKESLEYSGARDKKFDELYSSLQQKILALLPSAGAAGLASTYYDAKSRYAPTSFAGRLGTATATGKLGWLRKWLGYNPASVVATVFFYGMFILPLGFIIWESVSLLYRIENDPHFVLHYEMLVVRFLIVLPLATFSGFGFASLQLYRRLYEEYNHKQRVMELYQSFGEEISASGTDTQKKELLDIMLKSVSQKAWDVSATKPEAAKNDRDLLAKFERLIGDLAKLRELGGH